ncbi:Uncharacterized protein TCM_019108 [Theobroma cacao]|uniref:Uncharacterized protein n=1 Tax=Theobroma cacao TaxID=3641 RepID=A0A061EHK4_THECC|nr:Uncharacterized protein TCM_019108 [Theobroma cacao]
MVQVKLEKHHLTYRLDRIYCVCNAQFAHEAEGESNACLKNRTNYHSNIFTNTGNTTINLILASTIYFLVQGPIFMFFHNENQKQFRRRIITVLS